MEQKRVLVVDDDLETLALLRRLLSSDGLTVDTASDGDVALALLRQNSYSVMLLDLVMPRVDGLTVLQTLGASKKDILPVTIVLSGADIPTIARLDPSLVHGIVKKPFDPVELTSLIRACAEIRSRLHFDTMSLAAALGGSLVATLLSKI